jgi:hypothetical protein
VRALTSWLYLPRGWRVRWEFKAADVWVGAYPKRERGYHWTQFDLWICLLPMLPIHLNRNWFR